MDEMTQSVIQANESRAAIYRMLASLYFKELTDEQLDHIKELDFSTFEGLDEGFAEGCRDIERYLRKKNSATRQLLAVDYAGAILGAGVHEERRATPYESVFTSDDGLMMQDARDDVCKLMLEAHLEVDEKLRVPEDHLSFMFEYLAIMAERCNELLEVGVDAEALENLRTEQAFHRDHLMNWIDEYCDCLEGCAETRFYRGVAKMTRSFVHLDGELLADLIEAVEEMAAEAPPAEESAA